MGRITSRHARWVVPVAVAAAVVGGAQWQARAATSTPSLPSISARDLLVKAQSAHVTALSGTVRSTMQLGLPALPSQGGANWSSLVAGTQTLRVYADGPARQRVDLMGDLTQASVVHDGRTVWTWSSADKKVTRTTLPAVPSVQPKHDAPQLVDPSKEPMTPQRLADQLLAAVRPTTSVTVGRSARVAGRDAYDLRLVPKQQATLVGSVDLYVDARTGMALRAVVTPRGSADAAVDVGFTSLHLKAPAASTFRFRPPPGASVHDVTVPDLSAMRGDQHRGVRPSGRPQVLGEGWAAVLETPRLPVASAAAGDTTSGPAAALLRSMKPVHGSFGSGRLLSTRLLTVLQTDDGRVFAGMVTPAELVRVAGSPQARAAS